MGGVQRQSVLLGDGCRLSYLSAGPADGPALVLVHGLLSSSETWGAALGELARRGLRVLAVDLVGHGQSDKPAGSYLLDDFARSLEQFCTALGIEGATVCGHSLGGAIAVHFGYHYPARVARLVLVASGGLGREVSLALRGLSVPGSDRLIAAVLGRRTVQRVVRRALRNPLVLAALRLRPERLANLRRIGRALVRTDSRAAFFASLRGVIGPLGQRGSLVEMRYLAEHVPTLLIWGRADPIIPVAHAETTHRLLPGSELVIFDRSGHEPHQRNAAEFAATVATFTLSHSLGNLSC